MNFFEKIVAFLCYEVEAPVSFGAFHLVMLSLIIIAAAVCGVVFKRVEDRTFRKAFFIMWITLAVLEVYREVALAFNLTDGVVEWSYVWHQFPFQFCAMPLYTLPLIVFLKDGWLRDSVTAFVAFFSILGGIAVCLYPGDVLCNILGVNIQSLIHHGIQLITGVICIVRLWGRYGVDIYLKGGVIFGAVLCIALTLNVSVHFIFEAIGKDDTFNMFYISPYHDCTLPILSDIYKAVPYPVFLFVYIFAVCLGAALVMSASYGIGRLYGYCKKKCIA